MRLSTILDDLRAPYIFQCRKHGLNNSLQSPEEWADDQINALSNVELLEKIQLAADADGDGL